MQTAADCKTPGERPRRDRRGAAGRAGLDPARGRGGAASHSVPWDCPERKSPARLEEEGGCLFPGSAIRTPHPPLVSHSYLMAKQGFQEPAERC